MVIPRLIRQQPTKPLIINSLEQLQHEAVADYVPPLSMTVVIMPLSMTVVIIVAIIVVIAVIVIIIIVILSHNKQTVHQLPPLHVIGNLLLHPLHQQLVSIPFV